MTSKERIRSLITNLKNWSWDVFPTFKLEQEDAEALQDINAVKEYIAEQNFYAERNKEVEDSESSKDDKDE